jgi:hypothetical protein
LVRTDAVTEGIMCYQLDISTGTVEWASHTPHGRHSAAVRLYAVIMTNTVDFETGPATAYLVSADLMTMSH